MSADIEMEKKLKSIW